ncbi:hypothetical protein BMS3Bbin04_00285 [bacterium BMS3Bbin04]|nr:hypothetical protein BMS3Bbin04_00285 [bacterium BMS3Bbin04]
MDDEVTSQTGLNDQALKLHLVLHVYSTFPGTVFPEVTNRTDAGWFTVFIKNNIWFAASHGSVTIVQLVQTTDLLLGHDVILHLRTNLHFVELMYLALPRKCEGIFFGATFSPDSILIPGSRVEEIV